MTTLFQHTNGFTSIDNDIFYVQSLVSPAAFALLIRFYRQTQGYGVAVKAISSAYIQKVANLSKNSVTKLTKELETLGVLLVKRRARDSSLYQVSIKGVAEVAKYVKATLEEDLEPLTLELEVPVEEVAKVEEVSVDSFDEFWNCYDKKIAVADCRKEWNKLSQEVQQEIMVSLPEYIKSAPDKFYRKNPLTYLTNQVWLDEVIMPSNNAASTTTGTNTSSPVEDVKSSHKAVYNVIEMAKNGGREVISEDNPFNNDINEFFNSFGRKKA